MSTIQELNNELRKTDQDIMTYVKANPNTLPGDANLTKWNAYKAQLIREISEIQNPAREMTKAESVELTRILSKVEITRTASEAHFLATHINLKS